MILFITDDESPTLGCYGDPIAKTPHIDALAKDGTVFRQGFATTASCSASLVRAALTRAHMAGCFYVRYDDNACTENR